MSFSAKLLFGILLFSLFTFNLCLAQETRGSRVTASFTDQPASEILEVIEEQTGVSFYYKQQDLPKRNYTIEFTERTLEGALQELFTNTLTGYAIYRDYAVIILPKRLIEEVYTADYYEALENSITQGTNSPETRVRRNLKVGDIAELGGDGNAFVQGIVKDGDTRESIIGATVMWTDLDIATITDERGQFESTVPAGQHEILIEYIGYEDLRETIDVQSSGDLRLRLNKSAVNLDEVLIQADAPDASVRDAQISVARIDIQTIKKLPTFMGEADVIKSLLLNPGVSSIGEGATGFNVRGGEVDQNLLMQDEGFYFNSSHALGFFSTFNADLLSNVELYKGNIPAQYGGRLASVMKVDMRSGNFQQFRINGGVGPVFSRVSFEGPVIKDKSSFVIGLRSSYSDWILNRIDVLEVQRSSAFFLDGNLKYTHRMDDRNTFILSGYKSKDDFTYNEEFGFDYSTLMGQFSYRRIFSDNVFSNLSFTYNNYKSSQSDLEGIDASILEHEISYYKIKEQLTLIPNESLKVDAGLSSIYYLLLPGTQGPYSDMSAIETKSLETEKGLESAIFANAEFNVSDALLISAGLRMNLFHFLGPKTVFLYEDPDNPGVSSIIGSKTYESGAVITNYNTIEPRISFRYSLMDNASVKAGYSRTSQYINQIFNSDSPTPASQWQLSTQYIKPHLSHNLSLGYFHNFKNNNWETSAEIYYRSIDRLYDYRDFADLTVNDHIETELLEGIGRSYGFELSVKKKEGLFNGWLSYTRSTSERKIEGINFDEWYPSNFDKPHDFSFVLNYAPNQRHTITINFTYSTGRPTTPPVGNFISDQGLIVPVYTERNQLRIPDYHRLDVAYTIGQGYKKNKRFKTSWTISIYNLYSRKNAFSVFFTDGPFRRAQANKLSVLGSAFPAITFNFQFI